MQEVSDLERRITVALERIARAASAERPSAPAAEDAQLVAESIELRLALDEEIQASAALRLQVQERERASEEERLLHESEIGALKAIHATQSRDLVILVERLKSELAELQAERQAEAEEVARILAALGPLVEEA